MNIKSILIVAKREIKTRIENKWFLISLVALPLLLVGIYMFPVISFMLTKPEKVEIKVYDVTGKVIPYLRNTTLEFSVIKDEKEFDALRRQLKATEKKIVIVKIPDNIVKRQVNVVLYVNKNVPSKVKYSISKALKEALFYYKLEELGIPKERYLNAKVDVSLEYVKVSSEGEKKFSEQVGEIIGFGAAFLIYFLLMGYGSMMASSTMGEKRNKVVEMVLVAVKPIELLFGKIIGLAVLSIFQYSVWIFMTILFGFIVMFVFPVKNVDIPNTDEVSPEQVEQVIELVNNFPIGWDFIILLLVFFILGYLVYASLFAAFASIGDPDTDSGRYLMIAMLPIILAMATLGVVISNPASGVSAALSLIPFTSPIIMPVRIAMEAVSVLEIVTSIIILIISAYVITFIGAKIYKMNILSDSGRLTPKNLLYWLRG